MRGKLCIAILAACCLIPGAASADQYAPMRASKGPGPTKYNKVFVSKIGPASAKRILVLVPGFIAGAGGFNQLGRDLVAAVPNLQVWAVDRRSQAFEDVSVLNRHKPDDALKYYLPPFAAIDGKRFDPVQGSEVPFVRKWGLKLALEDLRQVVKAASSEGKRKVILGGHSLGASTTAAYASWDFNGTPGYKDLEGIVLLDGGLLGSFGPSSSLAATKKELKSIERGNPFVDLLGIGFPWITGPFAEIAGQYALSDPTGLSKLQAYPLLPKPLRPDFPVTNRGELGYAFDKTTSPPTFATIHVRAGELATDGSPRDWVDGENTPINRLATMLAGGPANAIEWYFPRRLSFEVGAVNDLKRTKTTDLLGLRPWHLRTLNLPLYAFQTDLTNGGVLRGAQQLIARSKITKHTLVDGPEQSHVDPLTGDPARSKMFQTLVPFLKQLP